MIKSLFDAKMTDILPQVMKEQASVRALSMAVEQLHQKTMRLAEKCRIFTDISALDESTLDALAVNWKIDWYDTEYDIEQKRRLVKTALAIRKIMGTAGSVRKQADAIYSGSIVQEWFEYGGSSGHYRLSVNVTTAEERERFEAMSRAEVERRFSAARRFSSHMDDIEYYEVGSSIADFLTAKHIGAALTESATAYRW